MKALILFFLLAPSLQAQTNQSYLYSVEQTPSVIEGWTINPTTGAIVALPNSPFADAGGPFAGATNSGGTFLWVVNPPANSISAFTINTDGSLTEIAGSPFSTGDAQQPSAIAISSDNQSLYVGSNFSQSNPNNGVLQTYSISANGGLSLDNAQFTEPFPVGFVVSQTSPFIYLAGFDHVDIYNTTTGVPVEAGSAPVSAEVAIGGNDSFLFVGGSNESGGPGILTILQINGDGSLSPFSTFDAPLEYTFQNLELQGNYLFTNFGTFLITGGVLSQLPENLNWFPSSPFAITASTQGPFLYTGSIPTSNPPGLIYPLLVSEGVVTNIEPPLILRGRANQFVIANTSVASTPAPAFVFEPSTLNFNPVNVGSSIVGLLLIYSTGSLPLEINNISISGSPVFSETNDCPSTLAPGQVCRVNVTFAPTSATSFVGSLNMTGNLDGSVPLTGAGIAPPTLTVTPPTQTIQAGQSATFQISVTGVSQTLTVSSCPIPNGTCSISGMTLMVMTTAPMTTAGLTNFTLPPTMVVTIALCVLGVCFVGNIRRWVFTTFK